jgi:hypothetical protein
MALLIYDCAANALAGEQWPRLRALDIVEPTTFHTHVVHRKDVALSTYARDLSALCAARWKPYPASALGGK